MLIFLYDTISWDFSVTPSKLKIFHKIVRYLFKILATSLIYLLWSLDQ